MFKIPSLAVFLSYSCDRWFRNGDGGNWICDVKIASTFFCSIVCTLPSAQSRVTRNPAQPRECQTRYFSEHPIPQFSKLKQEEENLLRWIVASCSVIKYSSFFFGRAELENTGTISLIPSVFVMFFASSFMNIFKVLDLLLNYYYQQTNIDDYYRTLFSRPYYYFSDKSKL